MSDKYIIKNCPCIVVDECNSFKDDEVFCKDCTDCVLKQIVELCEDEIELVKKWQEETKYPFKPTAFELAEKILNQLDIQEVE